MKIFLFTSLLSMTFFGLAEPCTMKTRVSDFVPQYYQDDQGNWKGMAVEMAEVLLNEVGCQAKFLSVRWERSLKEIKNGDLDMMMNLSITEERKEYLHFIGPMRDETISVVIHKRINETINNLDDFKKLPEEIAITQGAYFGEVFKLKYNSDAAFSAKIKSHPITSAFTELANRGRISGFMDDRYTLAWRIKHFKEYENLVLQPVAVNQDWVYFGFSKASVDQNQIANLQAAFERAKEKGKFEAVLRSYR